METGEVVEISPQMRGVPEAESLITVPLQRYGETVGRLYLTASRWRAFDTSDVRFLLQAFEHAMPTIENVQLLGQLASTAAEMERQRIARDLHDSVIQPYIGLKTGLMAIDQKLAAGRTDVRGSVQQLLEVIDEEVTDLRLYTHRLHTRGEREDGLLPMLQHFTERFAKMTGIAVHVEAETPLHVNDRLAAEAFQIVAEGLSNVSRHTHSAQATISLACCKEHLSLRIANDGAAGKVLPSFIPRSITQRTAALGGRTRVEQSTGGGIVVVVDIPL
jgi:signal transduction histidine kinase